MRLTLYVRPGAAEAFVVSHVPDTRNSFLHFRIEQIGRGTERRHSADYRPAPATFPLNNLEGYVCAGNFTPEVKREEDLLGHLHSLAVVLDLYVNNPPTQIAELPTNGVLHHAAMLLRGEAELPRVTLFIARQPQSRYQWESLS